jgi:hypothetical protein
MRGALSRCRFASLSLLFLCGAAGEAVGQDIYASPTYETLNLSAGFRPDPQVRSISAGGSTHTTLAGCSAYIHAAAPDVDLNYTAGSLPLIISATSGTDVVLLVNTPDGNWHCNDDGGDGTDARLTLSSPQSGNYNIWVGTYRSYSGDLPAAQLHISELRGASGSSSSSSSSGSSGSSSSNGSSSGSALNWRADPTYGTIDLSSGFSPDPYRRNISAGGRDDVPDLGAGCSGYVNASAPDLDLNYQAGDYPLNIYATSGTDITLIVNQPDGTWICSDDANGTNPHVRLSDPSSGNYNIWIGTYSRSSSPLPSSVLYISELSPKW